MQHQADVHGTTPEEEWEKHNKLMQEAYIEEEKYFQNTMLERLQAMVEQQNKWIQEEIDEWDEKWGDIPTLLPIPISKVSSTIKLDGCGALMNSQWDYKVTCTCNDGKNHIFHVYGYSQAATYIDPPEDENNIELVDSESYDKISN
jgi:hypothetical protein